MDGYLQNRLQEILDRKKQKNKKTLLLSVISVVLALTVSYLSVFPAITMRGNPVCGLEEHTHSAACYEDVLICGKEEDAGHVHTDACYQEVKTLICPLEEDENHTHDESCYITERVLICEQEEREAHTHTDECYEKQLICGKTEHVHTQDCYRHDFYEEDMLRVYEDDDVTVTVTLTEESMIPAEAQLVVYPITEESDKAKFDELFEKTGEEALDEDQVISDIRFYDISFQLAGEEIEPAAGTVKVSIRFNDPVFSMENMERASELKVLHFKESGNTVDVIDVTDVIENAEEGVTAVEFSTDSFSSFSIVLADTIVTGNFYQRVSTIDSTTASYLIVSAQGSYALSSTQSSYSRLATINPVKGNPDYYTASVGGVDAAGITDINWFFERLVPPNTTTQIQVNASQRLTLGSTTIVGSGTARQTPAYDTASKCWTIVASGYYLYMTPATGVFSRNNGTTSVQNRNVLIYKLVNTTLTIPGDVIYDDGTGGGSGEVKPPYDPYITPSGAKSDSYITGGGKTIAALSDAATSQIENQYADIQADDGKVVTDKSVIYGDDDYGAFGSYDDGVFGVAMSALGQEFNVEVIQEKEAPIDVIIIFDNSGSMVNNNVPGSPAQSRAAAAVPAINDTIDFIMSSNANNRVGVVNFSSGSWDFMQLARYYVGTAGATINYSPGYNYITMSTQTGAGTMATNTALRNADTRALAPSASITNWNGTYTQAGIAQAAAMLLRNSDTTFTEEGITVQRVPVIIMVSDGDPTHCTSNYMDVLNGPHYGSGVYTSAANNRGIQGYYTILSANYYKMQAAIHYEEVAKFFSIGMGIYATGYDDLSGNSATGDHYKRTVLNPTTQSIAELTNTLAKNYLVSSHQLRDLLNGTFSSSNVTVGTTNSYAANLGRTNTTVPVLLNQYTNYKYADDAFFGNFTTAELTDALQGAIVQSRQVYNYGFILEQATEVDMYDPLGVGMEVKGAPVLRFYGTNYAHTSTSTVVNGGTTVVTYHYDYTVTDPHTLKEYPLIDITVDVSTDSSGNQTVHMCVPENVLPVYQPDQAISFYYEALPVRLIFQTGLTQTALDNASQGDVFYTNRWDAGVTTTAVMLPTDDNPYYVDPNYQDVSENKTVNTTGTISTRYVTDLTTGTVTHFLGNNGRLEITDAPEDVVVTVNKVWYQYDGTVISDPAVLATLPDITVNLYQSTSTGGGGTLYDTVTFGNDEGWTYTWLTLPEKDGGGNPYYYSVTEASVDGYITTYQNNGGIPGGTITVDNTAGGMILPATGGVGLMPFIAGGLTVMIFMLMIVGCLFYIKKRKYERGLPRSPDG